MTSPLGTYQTLNKFCKGFIHSVKKFVTLDCFSSLRLSNFEFFQYFIIQGHPNLVCLVRVNDHNTVFSVVEKGCEIVKIKLHSFY